MKTISTIFISFVMIATAKASNVEITNSTLVTGTSRTTGTVENAVVLSWVAKNENSSSRYEIERSFYSNNFTTITSLQVPFTNNSVKNYRINDNAAELAGRAVAYYRIKEIAANGTVTYSNTMVVNLGNKDAAVKTTASIRFTAAQNGNAVIKIKSIAGNTAATTNTIVAKGNNTVELTNIAGLSKGIYVTEVSVNGIMIDTQKVILE
jgi:hypothetical protein